MALQVSLVSINRNMKFETGRTVLLECSIYPKSTSFAIHPFARQSENALISNLSQSSLNVFPRECHSALPFCFLARIRGNGGLRCVSSRISKATFRFTATGLASNWHHLAADFISVHNRLPVQCSTRAQSSKVCHYHG